MCALPSTPIAFDSGGELTGRAAAATDSLTALSLRPSFQAGHPGQGQDGGRVRQDGGGRGGDLDRAAQGRRRQGRRLDRHEALEQASDLI